MVEVEGLTRDLGVAGLNLIGGIARDIILCLELGQPRKTRPDITETLSTWT